MKTFVVGLYCGAAHHDVAFVGHGGIVRLFDFDAHMCALARFFFPDENRFCGPMWPENVFSKGPVKGPRRPSARASALHYHHQ